MDFVLNESGTFVWPVKIKQPDPEKPGKHKTVSFNATFLEQTQEVVDKLIIDPDTRDQTEFMRRALVSFEGTVRDEDGDEVPEDDHETRNRIILSKQPLLEALFEAYGHGHLGNKPKN